MEEQRGGLSRKNIALFLVVALLSPLAVIFYFDGWISILATLWLFGYEVVSSESRFFFVIQSISTVILWVWRFVFLYAFLRFYRHRFSFKQLKIAALIAQIPWIMINLGNLLNILLSPIYGRIDHFAIPIPSLVIVGLIILRWHPPRPLPKDWLRNDDEWGPTIRLDDADDMEKS